MRERERRFEEVMKRIGDKPGVMANRIIELEDRVRELQDEMASTGLKLMNIAKNAR